VDAARARAIAAPARSARGTYDIGDTTHKCGGGCRGLNTKTPRLRDTKDTKTGASWEAGAVGIHHGDTETRRASCFYICYFVYVLWHGSGVAADGGRARWIDGFSIGAALLLFEGGR